MRSKEYNDKLESTIKNYKYVILDFDGTIIHLNTNWKELKDYLSNVFSVKIERLFDFIHTSNNKDEVFFIIYQYENKNIDYKTVNKKILKILDKNNRRFAIFSLNTKKTIINVLTKLNIYNKFDLIISCEEVTNFKPDPEGLEKILKFWKCKKNEVIFIGDSWKDMKAGEKAGIKTLII
ncbi:MAG: HAD family hydrolase [Promethearchaeota archaeon]